MPEAQPEDMTVRRPDPGYPGSPEFPARLLDLDDPPARLFVRGVLPAGRMVAIVGSRAATPYGLAQARRLAGNLAALGIPVVSGLARGIDAAAHLGALDAGGRTVAVLPGSLDRVSPASHAELAERIAAQGALVAEWETGVIPYASSFLERNRLIAALASVTVVVEAAARSGALSTARVARSLGRPVLAVPGDIDRPTSRGCHALIRAGAGLCESAADVLAALGGVVAPAEHAARDDAGGERAGARGAGASATVSGGASATVSGGVIATGAGAPSDPERIATRLRSGACRLDELAGDSGVPVERALAALLELEWAGVVVATAGQRWALSAGGAA